MNAISPNETAEAWSLDTVSQVLRDEFGLNVTSLSPLGGEHDQTLVATLDDGERVVAKISPSDADINHIRWQQRLLRTVDVSPIPLVVPRVVTTKTGAPLALVNQGQRPRIVRVQTWIDGTPLDQLERHSPELMHELGQTAARMVVALREMPISPVTTHHWDILRSPQAIALVRSAETDPQRQSWVERFLGWFGQAVEPVVGDLPRSAVHQDFNDANVLAHRGEDLHYHIAGVVDFGDALYTARISELAVAVAYAMLRKADPLLAAGQVVRGFNELLPLSDAEISVIYPMAATRLCVNALTWNYRGHLGGTAYGQERSRHSWPAIERLSHVTPDVAEAWLHHVLQNGPGRVSLAPAPPVDIAQSSVGAIFDDADLGPGAIAWPERGGARSDGMAGRHLTPRRARLIRRATEAGEPPTIHLGADVYADELVQIMSPLTGVVESLDSDGAQPGHPDVVVLRHVVDGQPPFWSRWTGLRCALTVGDRIEQGALLGEAPGVRIPSEPSFRVATFLSSDTARLAPSFVPAWQIPAWRAVAPDPSPLLGIQRPEAGEDNWDVHEVARVRDAHLARSQRSYYRRPMNLVGSDGVWLHDENGHRYLDSINNVTHVGHANRRVVEAAHRQMLRLNTNSRFIYDGLARYSQRLVSLLPSPLEVVFFVCTGTEANDLALRIARQVTGRHDILVIDGAYHGSTGAAIEISPNRYKSRGGLGRPPTTHEVLQPNRYRGEFGYNDPYAGRKYAQDVSAAVDRLASLGRPPAAFFAESLMGTAGCITLPEGYLSDAFSAVRSVGGLCISDEVQVGFGRMGDSFWAFELQDVIPDIITMGKPIGNGHPMAAVVTTREIAEAFDSGVKFFNTFAGNPVSCAIGMAVLDEIEDRQLQARAHEVGNYFLDSLRTLMGRHDLIGDVRGHGLYAGIELVRDRISKEPAAKEAAYVCERMKEEGVIVYPTGTYDNVLKLKPPMIFEREHADIFTATLDGILAKPW